MENDGLLGSGLGARLRSLREKRNFTQDDVAQRMGLTCKGARTMVSALERDYSSNPTVRMVARYLRAVGYRWTDVLDVLDKLESLPEISPGLIAGAKVVLPAEPARKYRPGEPATPNVEPQMHANERQLECGVPKNQEPGTKNQEKEPPVNAGERHGEVESDELRMQSAELRTQNAAETDDSRCQTDPSPKPVAPAPETRESGSGSEAGVAKESGESADMSGLLGGDTLKQGVAPVEPLKPWTAPKMTPELFAKLFPERIRYQEAEEEAKKAATKYQQGLATPRNVAPLPPPEQAKTVADYQDWQFQSNIVRKKIQGLLANSRIPVIYNNAYVTFGLKCFSTIRRAEKLKNESARQAAGKKGMEAAFAYAARNQLDTDFAVKVREIVIETFLALTQH